MECISCPLKHPVLYKEIDGVDQINFSPQCFSISDQNFPAFLPAMGEGECIKILRIEDATLDKLVTFFLETIRGFAVPAGSVVLIHSATHMSWVGAAAYAEDLIAAQRRIVSAFGNSVIVIHGLPLLGSGSEDPGLIKSLVIVTKWYELMMDSVRDITATRKCWLSMLTPGSLIASGTRAGSLIAPDNLSKRGSPMAPCIINTAGSPMASAGMNKSVGSSMTPVSTGGATGSPMAPAPGSAKSAGSGSAMPSDTLTIAGSGSPMASLSGCAGGGASERVRLPGDMSGRSYTIFDVGGVVHASKLAPLSELSEGEIVGKLLRELNDVFALDLDVGADTWRGGDCEQSTASEPPVKKRRIIVVGASHATRLAAELKEMGEHVLCLAAPTWRLSDSSTPVELKRLVNTAWPGDTVVVYQIYDSSIYFASSGPGEMSLPRREKDDGRFHVEGALKMADRDTFKQIVYGSVPLLRAGGEGVKIVVAPMPRYITGPCCSNRSHVTNFGEKRYGKVMGDRLADIGDWLKEFVFGKRITNFQVFSPTLLTMSPDDTREEMRATWGKDPVHLSKHGYAKEARALVEQLNKEPELERSSRVATSQQVNRGRTDWSINRQPWVSRSDATATRDYGQQSRDPSYNRRGGNANMDGWSGSRGWRRGGHGGHSGPRSFNKSRGRPY